MNLNVPLDTLPPDFAYTSNFQLSCQNFHDVHFLVSHHKIHVESIPCSGFSLYFPLAVLHKMEISDPSAATDDDAPSNNPQEMDEPNEELILLNPEQEAIYKRRLELKKTQQDLIKLVNKLHEFVNRDRNGNTVDNSSSSSCGDVMVEMENSEEVGVEWEQLTNYVNQHVTELQEIRNLSSLTGVLLNRLKKIINGPEAVDQKKDDSDGRSEE